MFTRSRILFPAVVILIAGFWLSGCSGDTESTESTSGDEAGSETSAGTDDSTQPGTAETKKHYAPVRLGGTSGTESDGTASTGTSKKPHNINDVIAALKPLQVVMGKWEGVLKSGGAPESHEWVWDLTTDKKYPALSLSVTDGNFFKSARITFDPTSEKYRMETVDEEEIVRQFEGGFDEEPADEPGDDGKTLHRSFKLKLTEIPDEGLSTRWEYVFSQRNNNRYQLLASRARGSAKRFTLRDVIGSQRSGTSFAQADDDYGDRTCVISQGLGTIEVSYQGKSYYVCCTGCRAAFEDDPEMWIARWEEIKAQKKK